MERREKAGILPTEETGIPIGRVPSYYHAAFGICKSDDGEAEIWARCMFEYASTTELGRKIN